MQPSGLRERKKARTRETIQRHALQLFFEQGYDRTTVDQIAAAAEVSPSTFFRYFGSKEEVVAFDAMDEVMIATFLAQPAELTAVQAVRATLRQIFSHTGGTEGAEGGRARGYRRRRRRRRRRRGTTGGTDEEGAKPGASGDADAGAGAGTTGAEAEWTRMKLMSEIPELRARMADGLAGGIAMLSAAAARRSGRAPEDLVARVWAGAVTGIVYAVFDEAMTGDQAHFVAVLDTAIGLLEDALAL